MPPKPVEPSKPVGTESDKSSEISGNKIIGTVTNSKTLKIIVVLAVIGIIALIGAIAVPSLVESKMNSEDAVDTEIDYTEISTEENGDYVVYGYNEDDLLIEENYYGADDNFEGCTEYVYDEDGNKTGYKVYNENKKLIDSHKY